MGRNVKLLERKGLIDQKSGSDLREALLSLSEKGISLLTESESSWKKVQVGIEAKLGTHGTQQLIALLNAL